ncbi:unnamed protein product [Closterium sp. Naga37s-1]|nr:unnamed protein product [Closterium sp. Naga37s-1]
MKQTFRNAFRAAGAALDPSYPSFPPCVRKAGFRQRFALVLLAAALCPNPNSFPPFSSPSFAALQISSSGRHFPPDPTIPLLKSVPRVPPDPTIPLLKSVGLHPQMHNLFVCICSLTSIPDFLYTPFLFSGNPSQHTDPLQPHRTLFRLYRPSIVLPTAIMTLHRRKRRPDGHSRLTRSFLRQPALMVLCLAAAAAAAAALGDGGGGSGFGGVSGVNGVRRRALSAEEEARLAHARVRVQELVRLGIVGARGRDAQAEAAQRGATGRTEYNRLLFLSLPPPPFSPSSPPSARTPAGASSGLRGFSGRHSGEPERGTTGAADCRTASTGMRSLIRRTGMRAPPRVCAHHHGYARTTTGMRAAPGICAQLTPAAPVVVWADEQAGAELNALLAFKAAVIDFQNALRSWVVPRHAANSSLSPAAFFCRWRFVSCSKPTAPKAVAAGAAAGAAASRSVIALQIPEPGLNTSAGGVTEDLGILLSSTLNVTTSIATSLANSTSDGGSSSSSAAIPPLLPQEFSSLTALETLTIRNSADFPVIAGLSGAFPTQLSACYSLSKLELTFTGSLSPAFAVATLGQFDASNNKLSGPLPDLKACAVATVLQGVFLANNSFTGSIPRGFICKQMLSLDLRNNSLSGDLPDVLVGLNSKQIPSAAVLKASPHFAQLNLSHNSFTGPIPLGGNCKDLTQLFLDHNNFSGPAAPEALATCRNIIYYDASNNQLSGTAADVVDKLSKSLAVVGVRLGGNRIEGEIPDNIYTLSSIRELNLSGNVLAGSIPSTVASLNRLQVLDVSGNGLSSSLPSSLGTLSYLSLLDVSRNGLSGPIPPELAPPFLPFLTLLNVSHNAFSGAIPFGFSNTNTTATALDFSYNNLSGPIYPGNLSLLPASAFAANPALCGGAGYPDCPAPPGQALSTGAVVGIVVACVAALALAVGGVWYALFYQRSTGLEGGTMLVFERLDFKLNIRSILDATDTFSNKYLLGRGGFGSVYKATLADGRDVAIKRLALGSSQGQREFEAEMHTLGAVRHRNLVVLVAAYLSRPPSQERLLIYDFLPGGSLDHVLDRDMPKGSPMRRWERGRLSYKSDVFAFGVLILQVITGKLPTDEEFAERGLARWVGANSIANIVDRRIDDREEYMDEMKGVVTLGLRCTSRVAADRPSMAEALELLEELSTFAEGISGGKEEAGGGVGKQQE